jgi:hypothetical protein
MDVKRFKPGSWGRRTTAWFTATAVFCAVLVGAASGARAVVAPDNDSLAGAQVLGAALPATAAGTTVGATGEPGEPDHAGWIGGSSVWYRWTPSESGSVVIDTCDGGSATDTLLGVYTGAAVDTLTEVSSNNDAPLCGGFGQMSRVAVGATAGTTYLIAVATNDQPVDQGDFVLTIRASTGPANDLFSAAEALGGALPIRARGTNLDATLDGGEPDHGGTSAGYSVWYRWTPAVTGRVTIETCGSTFNTNLGVYTGRTVAALSTVGSSHDGCGWQSMATYTAQAGTTYHIAVDGSSGGDPKGSILLTIRTADPPPANDSFAEPRVLSGPLPMTASGTNVSSSTQPGEPVHVPDYDAGPSVWYSWTSPVSGPVVVDTCGSSLLTLLGVYTGTAVDSLTSVARNATGCGLFQSAAAFDATAGTTYRIAVAGRYGSQGAIVVHIHRADPPANDDFTAARELPARLPIRTTGTNVDATKEPREPDPLGFGGANSVWYRWTPRTSGPVTVETCGSEIGGANRSTILNVWTGTAVDALTSVPGQRAGTCGLDETITFPAVAGTTYRIAVDSPGYSGGSIRLVIRNARPPANDDFADAEELKGALPIRARGTNLDATRQGGEPSVSGRTESAGPSVWYRWTPTASGQVTIETCGSSFDSQFAVYAGDTLDALTRVVRPTQIAHSCGLQDRATFQATAGTTYRIAVDGRAAFGQRGDQGTVQLTLRRTSRPANDDFADARVLAGPRLPLRATGSTSGATHEAGEPFHLSRGSTAVWYRWTATTSGPVVIETCGSEIDTLMVVYTGAAIGTLTSVASSENRCGDQSSVTVDATAGTTYMIAIDSWGSEGGFTVTIRRPNPPGNDDVTRARKLHGHLPVSVTGTNVDATREPGEPVHSGEGSGSIWHRWTPRASGEVTVDTDGTPFRTSVAIYTGTSVEALTRVATGTDDEFPDGDISHNRITFFATAGTTYLIAVDGNGLGFGQHAVDSGREGPIRLALTCDRGLPHCR